VAHWTCKISGLWRTYVLSVVGSRIATVPAMTQFLSLSGLLLLSVACSAGTAPEPAPGGSSSGANGGDSTQAPSPSVEASSSSGSSTSSVAECSWKRFDLAQCAGGNAVNSVGEINGKCVAYVYCNEGIPCKGSLTCTPVSPAEPNGKGYCSNGGTSAFCQPTR
jgi:hypothetical protein